MKRWIKWAVVAVLVLLVAGFAARAIGKRRMEAAAAAAPASAPAALELGAADVIAVRIQPLTRTLSISGSSTVHSV